MNQSDIEQTPLVPFVPKMAYSWSRIKMYEECPAAFKLKYIDKEKEVGASSPVMLVGAVVHAFIESYLNRCQELGVETAYDEATPLIMKAMETEPELAQEHFEEVEELCFGFVKEHKHDLQYTKGVELRLAIDRFGKPVEWMSPDVFLRGIVDLLRVFGDKAEITDWKSGFKTDAPKFQLKLYALLLLCHFPELRQFIVALEFLRMKRMASAELTVEDVEKFVHQLAMVVKRIENDTEYKPRPGAACNWCSYFHVCPTGRKDVRVARSADEATEVAEQIALKERELKNLYELIETYCGVGGAVRHNGIQYAFEPTETVKIPTKGFLELCSKSGVDPEPYVSVPAGNKKMKALMAVGAGSNPEAFATALSVLTNVKLGSGFKVTKVGNEED